MAFASFGATADAPVTGTAPNDENVLAFLEQNGLLQTQETESTTSSGNLEAGFSKKFSQLICSPGYPSYAYSDCARIETVTRQTPAASPTNADSVTWQFLFNENMLNVDATDFAVTGTTGSINISGSLKTWNVTASGGNMGALNGTVTVGLAPGQNMVGQASGVPAQVGVKGANINTFVMDNAPPIVNSITLSGAPASTATSIVYVVAFSESAANVSTDDFVLTATGSAAGNIASVSAASGSSINVTVNGLTGNGTLRLDLIPSSNITDALGNGNNTNGYIAAYTSGSVHTVALNNAPTDISLTGTSVNQSSGLNAPIGTLSSTDPDVGNTHTYTLVSGAGDTDNGSFNISAASLRANNAAALAAGLYSVRVRTTDNASGIYEEVFSITVIDDAPPAATSIVVSGSPSAADTSMAFAVSFNESASNISPDDFSLATTGSASGTIASVSASSGTSVNVNVIGISGNGTLKLNLSALTNITDALGNGNNSNGYVAPFTAGSSHTVAVPTIPGPPTIGTATAGDGQASVTFSAPGSNGGSAITIYTATANPNGATGNCAGPAACTITVTGLNNGTPYTFTVTATNAIGTSAASGISGSATPKGVQTITFPQPVAQSFGASLNLGATASASSGLAVAFTSSTTGVCTTSIGGALTFVSAGTCTIDANQAGNSSYLAATPVPRSFTVNATAPSSPTIGTATAGDTQATVTFTAPASNGGANVIGYTVTASPGVATGTGAGSPITVTGLTNGVSYTFTVTATNSATLTGGASAASNSVTPASPQLIIFVNPGAQDFGSTPTLSATSDSGLSVVLTSSTTGVCTILGGTLTFLSTGSCTINADQAGNGSFLAATQVPQTFTVNAVAPGIPTAVTATAGDTSASVAFTAPVSTGGSVVTGYTVTSSPGGITGTGPASPIAVNGLTNGTTYTFTVTASNSIGPGAPSAASNAVVPRLLAVAGTVPGMTGTATATLSGGGPSCTLNPTSGFASLSNPAPAGKTMPYGEYAFQSTSCVGTVSMALTYPEALPAGTQFWKYGPATPAVGGVVAASTWFQLSGVTLSGDRKTVTYTVDDNGVGDSDGVVGSISDPFALAAGPVGGGAVGIPVDAPWALGLLSAMLGFLGWRRQRGLSRG